ncbi:cell elongation-specific peptidoglycan biosynthesis regulator RodA [Murinocardiopsis flavida]|uniref:peptidoglycan glycosyltransferase n=1 Tax=Murinocardiopsis flavida TaxID=645275 RepID=A0A2P8DMA7_9ACTN|nr:FtsW/RodA/SpoVE family cell cycle protein [Murinocardiopsis flavida]PSK98346.1 cell elongation-specific peptidoglycan biosynthesis regulator RodA [Murinocardiopsis flavida]
MTTPEPPRRRNTELGLLVAALFVLVVGAAAAGLESKGSVPPALAAIVVVLGTLAFAAHGVLRRAAPWADPLILPVAVLLNGIGLTVIWALHQNNGGNGSPLKQLLWSALGILAAVAVLAAVRDPRRLQRYPYLMAVAAIVLIAIPIAPVIGLEIYGARRWIGIGGLTVQPSEFAKITGVVFLASYLVNKREVLSVAVRRVTIGRVKVFSIPRLRDTGPVVSAWLAAILLLVGTKDLGTSLLLFALFLSMLYVATQRKSWVAIGLVLFAIGATIASTVFWHVRQRVDIWLAPFDPEVYRSPDGSHQVVQGLFALADGGITGTGFVEGRSARIFAADSDYILVSIGEKLGLAGLSAVVVLLALLVERGYRVALASRDPAVKMMASGFAFLLAFQTFVVLGGVTRLIPLTGMTTPLLSAGGSALLSNWIIVGLWLRMSDTARRPARPTLQSEGLTQEIALR